MQITNEPQLYVLDTPGVLVPQIDSPETGFNLSLLGAPHRLYTHARLHFFRSCSAHDIVFLSAGCIKDDAIGEAELAEYMLYVLNKESEKKYVQVC
jgi:hypothetical protein